MNPPVMGSPAKRTAAVVRVGALFDLGVVAPAGRRPPRSSYQRAGPLDMRMGRRAVRRRCQRGRPADAGPGHPPLRRGAIRRQDRRRHRRRPPHRRYRPVGGRRRGVRARRCGDLARRTFQAIRIAVNDEPRPRRRPRRRHRRPRRRGGGRIVIAYHSLEDRIVKRRLVAGSRDAPPSSSGARVRHHRRAAAAHPQAAAPGHRGHVNPLPQRLAPGGEEDRIVTTNTSPVRRIATAPAPTAGEVAGIRGVVGRRRPLVFTVVVLAAFFGLIGSRISLNDGIHHRPARGRDRRRADPDMAPAARDRRAARPGDRRPGGGDGVREFPGSQLPLHITPRYVTRVRA